MPRARMSVEVKERLAAHVARRADPADAVAGQHLVVENVRRWIFEGVLRDGDVLSQHELAEVLGLSRIPVRDGLIALASSGWVTMEPGVGSRAVGLGAADVRDSLELFGEIWALVIRRVVERAVDPAPLRVAANGVKASTTAAQMTKANESFVDALLGLAAAPRLTSAFHNASRIVPGRFFAVVPNAVEVQRRTVPRIASAIARADAAKGAEHAMAQHRAHARNLIALLASRGVLRAS